MVTDTDVIATQYQHQPLDIEKMDKDPLNEFKRWYALALTVGEMEANAMSLATVDADHHPQIRMVLMKALTATGITFFTNYRSAKAMEIKNNHHVALVFWWMKQHRQVRMTGMVGKLPAEESARYFALRPRASQVNAVASPQSQQITSRAWLLQKKR